VLEEGCCFRRRFLFLLPLLPLSAAAACRTNVVLGLDSSDELEDRAAS